MGVTLEEGMKADQDLARKIWAWESRYKVRSKDLWNHYMETGNTLPEVPSQVAQEWRDVWDAYCHRMALDHRRDTIDFSRPLREFTTVEEKTIRSYEKTYGLCSVELYDLAQTMSPAEWTKLSTVIAGIDVWLAAWRYWCRLHGLNPATAQKEHTE